MPNGGSDCCATCPFNLRGNRSIDSPQQDYCKIRALPIRISHYTYCANHPHRNPERLEIPIGPVWEGTSDGFREIWKLAPSTEEIRLTLLNLLRQIQEQPNSEYPIGIYADEIIIWQLGELRESRALGDLHRIIAFSPVAQANDPFSHNREITVAAGENAIAKIVGSIPLDFLEEPPERPHPIDRLPPIDLNRNQRNEHITTKQFLIGQGILFLLGFIGMMLFNEIFVLAIANFVAYIWSIFWAYSDAKMRMVNGYKVALLAAFPLYPIGVLIWFGIRPRLPFR